MSDKLIDAQLPVGADRLYVPTLDGDPDVTLSRWQQADEPSLFIRSAKLFRHPRLVPLLRPLLRFLPSRYMMYPVQIGWLKTSIGLPVLFGIVAIRVWIYTTREPTRVDAYVDTSDAVLATTRPEFIDRHLGVGIWSANLWLDSARLPPGRCKLWMATYVGDERIARIRRLVASRPQDEVARDFAKDIAMSDAFVPSPSQDVCDLEQYVLSQPVEIHRPSGGIFAQPINSILVLRTDQLGDVAASLPAMARLRALYPLAKITALTQEGVQPILAASNLVDDFLTIKLNYDPKSERRKLTDNAEHDIRKQLSRLSYDLAIDLMPGDESRDLLRWCSAKYRIGFKPEQFNFLDFGVEVISRDKVNAKSIVSHAAHVMMLIQCMEIAQQQIQAVVTRNSNLSDREILRVHGLEPGEYIVVHSGARHTINRWPLPHFVDAAIHLAKARSIKVLLFIDLPLSPIDQARCDATSGIIVAPTLTTDEFDAVVSNAQLMLANDSGPKHLASSRGVPVVSISIPRLNWREWGQNRGGVTISRKVPCAGCGVNLESHCAKGGACISTIPVDVVQETILSMI